MAMDLEDFHDAVFFGLTVHWEAGVVELSFGVRPTVNVVIRAEEFTDVHVPRRREWGSSVSVNRISQRLDSTVLEVELQSGDLLVVHASRFGIDEGTVPPQTDRF
jgi:hypothetical protein